jgi:hypothetical protein
VRAAEFLSMQRKLTEEIADKRVLHQKSRRKLSKAFHEKYLNVLESKLVANGALYDQNERF